MSTPPIPPKELKRREKALIDAVKAGHRPPGVVGKGSGAVSEAAQALGIPRGTLSTMVSGSPELAEAMGKAWTPPETREVTPLHLAQAERSRRGEADAKEMLKKSLKVIGELEDKLANLQWSSKVSYKPADWSYKPTGKREKANSQHVPELLASDFQVGEVIQASEVQGNAYSTDIFRQRYRKLISTTIKLSMEHSGPSWVYPGIIYARGGDAISGAIHEELARTDDLDPFDCVIACVEEETTGILELAKAFGKVEVKSVFGNHGRIDKKPPHKKMARRNYEYILERMIQDKFRDDKRVSFHVTDSPDVIFPIYGKNICLTHGDRIGSRGGMGMVGPVATCARGAQRVIQQQSAMGNRVDQVQMGHFHTTMYGGYYLVNGSLPGYSEYAFSGRMNPEPPQQTLMFFNEKHGLVDMRFIRLD